MNRMRRLLGEPLLFSVLLVSALAGRTFGQQEREYGWYVDQQDTLVFVVQLDPAELAALQSNVDLVGESANMPPELVGRVTRVEVRLGEAPLPRTPSLQEIAKRPAIVSNLDVSDILGEGRLAEIDESNLVRVQSGTVGLPNLSARSASNDFLNGAGGQAARPLPSTSGSLVAGLPPVPSGNSSKFSDTAPVDRALPLPGNLSSPASAPLNSNPNMPAPPVAGLGSGTSRVGNNSWSSSPTNPASRGAAPPPSMRSALTDVAGSTVGAIADAAGNAMRTTADSLSPQYRTAPSTQGAPPPNGYDLNRGYDPSRASDPNRGFDPPPLGTGLLASSRTPARNFGSVPGTHANTYQPSAAVSNLAAGTAPTTPYPGYGSAQQNNIPQNPLQARPVAGSTSLPPQSPIVAAGNAGFSGISQQNFDLLVESKAKEMADKLIAQKTEYERGRLDERQALNSVSANPTLLAAGATTPTAQRPATQSGNSASDSKAPENQNSLTANSSSGPERHNYVVMFFMVSLVGNLYLVYLIRKLLTRYRSLLSTVRSHAV
ncbi:MAG: hypothetical protein AAF394_08110 [Planctomycetota bacterium]